MVSKYLKLTSKRMAEMFLPTHPLYLRCHMLDDGSLVPAESYDDVDMDKFPQVVAPTITDCFRSGQEPPKMGHLGRNSVMTDAAIAERFVSQFKAAGRVPDAESTTVSTPVPTSAPAPESAPVSTPQS